MVYDLIILGAGPAGLSAGIYAGRAMLKTLILEKGVDGGQIITTSEIENYPGQLAEGETGESLAARMSAQAARFGCERARENIRSVSLDGEIKVLAGRKREYRAKSLIIATGASPRPIGCQNESDYIGRGLSYCATCDAGFYKGLRVFVAGGGDSAVEEAVYLTRFARSVTIVHRRDSLRAAKSIQQRAFENPGIDIMWNSVIREVGGEPLLSYVDIENVQTGAVTRIEKQPGDEKMGVFGLVGNIPGSTLFEGIVQTQNGYIVTDEHMKTSISGVFAAGDVRAKPLRQVVTAAADGAVAAVSAERYLEGLEH